MGIKCSTQNRYLQPKDASTSQDAINPKLIAFCSGETNNVSIVDTETKKELTNFQGATLLPTSRNSQLGSSIIHFLNLITLGNSWTHVKEIPNTRLVCSLSHDRCRSAKLSIFDISRRNANMVLSTEEIRGGNLINHKLNDSHQFSL